MPTVIEIYPRFKKPKWLKVGRKVECLGEGKGNVLIVEEIDEAGCRAGLSHGCWESFTKLYRPGREKEDLKHLDKRSNRG